MTTAEVRDEADAGSPEVLEVAPRPLGARSRRTLVAAALVGVLVVAGLALGQRLQPPPDLTLAQLQSAYAGMVRSEGANDVSTIDRSRFPQRPLRISPEACTPLFLSTVSNQFPPAALDGVATYWLGPTSISLFTVRYADAATAGAAFAAVADASTGCAGQVVRFSGPEEPGRVVPVAVEPPADAPDQVAFALDRGLGQGRYALHVLRLGNTVTWQYRYETRRGAYDPMPAQQLMAAVGAQLLAVQRGAGG
jgi:hypothetical protein